MSPSRRRNYRGYIPGAGLPLGVPLGPSEDQQSAQVSDLSATLRGTNTPDGSSPPSSAPGSAQRVTKQRLAQIANQATDRDMAVLRLVAAHRFLTTRQLQQLAFTGHASQASAARTTRRVLARLERWGLLRSLGRQVGGVHAGSSAAIWQLAPAGARLTKADGVTYRVSEPSLRFLQHCLATGDVHVLLKRHEQIETVESVDVQVESEAWQRYTGLGGEACWLQPDLATTITTTDYIDRWFIEVDLGTESLPTLLKKCAQYEAYRQSGIQQTKLGSFPLVLWLFTDPTRIVKLHRAVNRTASLTPELFRYADPSTIASVLANDPTDPRTGESS